MIIWAVIEATEGITFVENNQPGKNWKHFTFRFNDGDAEQLAHYLNEQAQFVDAMAHELGEAWIAARAKINRRKARQLHHALKANKGTQ